MDSQTRSIDDEIRLMRSRSRRENWRQFLRRAAVFGSAGIAGLFGLVVFQSESHGIGCAIVATVIVTQLQNRRPG